MEQQGEQFMKIMQAAGIEFIFLKDEQKWTKIL